MDKREQIYKGINKWIGVKVDELVGDNIWLALLSQTAKRTASELIEGLLPMDILIPMLSNRGIINAEVVADELITALNNIPDYTQDFGAVAVHLSRGVIKIELPSSGIVSSLLKGNNVLKFGEDDIRELAKFINESKE